VPVAVIVIVVIVVAVLVPVPALVIVPSLVIAPVLVVAGVAAMGSMAAAQCDTTITAITAIVAVESRPGRGPRWTAAADPILRSVASAAILALEPGPPAAGRAGAGAKFSGRPCRRAGETTG
jgi:hypothetical protein